MEKLYKILLGFSALGFLALSLMAYWQISFMKNYISEVEELALVLESIHDSKSAREGAEYAVSTIESSTKAEAQIMEWNLSGWPSFHVIYLEEMVAAQERVFIAGTKVSGNHNYGHVFKKTFEDTAWQLSRERDQT